MAKQSQGTTPAAEGLTRHGPLALLSSGRKAFGIVPGLKGFLVKGFLINLALFFVLVSLTLALVYPLMVAPMADYLDSLANSGGFWAGLWHSFLSWLFILVKLLVMTLVVAGSFIISLAMMSLYFEALAARIMAHLGRGSAEEAQARFSISRWTASIVRSLKDSVVILILIVVAFILGIIPFIGPLLALLLNGFLLGWEIREPYLVVRAEQNGSLTELRQGLRLWTIKVGILPLLVAMVPLIGWLLLPLLMIFLVAGVSYTAEQARAGGAS